MLPNALAAISAAQSASLMSLLAGGWGGAVTLFKKAFL